MRTKILLLAAMFLTALLTTESVARPYTYRYHYTYHAYQGGHYAFGRGSSHRGGHYMNWRTVGHYRPRLR